MRPFIFLLFLKVPIGFMNELLDVDGAAGAAMAASEPSRAGSITGNVVVIERQDDNGENQYLLRVVTKCRNGQYILNANNPNCEDRAATDDLRTLARLRNLIDPLDLPLGESFMREVIPTLFGEDYNPGNWDVGHVVLAEKKCTSCWPRSTNKARLTSSNTWTAGSMTTTFTGKARTPPTHQQVR
jgi:hypothetical protein